MISKRKFACSVMLEKKNEAGETTYRALVDKNGEHIMINKEAK